MIVATFGIVLALAQLGIVEDSASLRRALNRAKAGTVIQLASGTFEGGVFVEGVHGEAGSPVVIQAQDPSSPPKFTGGKTAIQFSKVKYIEVRNIVIDGATENGLNIDDGGPGGDPAEGIVLKNIRVSNIGPTGNCDGIKLSGVSDFQVLNCFVEKWGDGGSAIDMVGCSRGKILDGVFRLGGASGVQMKGGTRDITVRGCLFESAGLRAVNIGGSTGLAFFRPNGVKFEARGITVENCRFAYGEAHICFVGVDGATVRHNTLYRPSKWAIRILQENSNPGMLSCQNATFENNIIDFQSTGWSEGGINVGPGVLASTFRFLGNVWYCEDSSALSKPMLPTKESDGTYGEDPMFVDPSKLNLALRSGSTAVGKGYSGKS